MPKHWSHRKPVLLMLDRCIQLIMRTQRWQIDGLELLKGQEARLICSWHGELAMNAYCLYQNQYPIHLLASQHKDGELITLLLKKWKFQVIRGSTQSRDALKATKTMIHELKQQSTIGITSDGPKGPIHTVKPASIKLALKQGAKILTMRAKASKAIRLNTWDQFTIPKPFGTIKVEIKPFHSQDRTEIHKDIAALEEQLCQ